MKLIIDKEQYNNLNSMLKSKDKESNDTALTILNNLDFENKKNILYFLLLIKKTRLIDLNIKKNCKNIINYLDSQEEFDLIENLTYNRILGFLKKINAGPEEIEIFVQDLNEYLLEEIKETFSFVESITVNINYNES
jgi:hypothetical protein